MQYSLCDGRPEDLSGRLEHPTFFCTGRGEDVLNAVSHDYKTVQCK